MSKNKVLIPLNKSERSQKILPQVEKFISAQENELILFYLTKPPRGIGFGVPDPGSGYALKPGGEPVGPKTHPISATQQEDSIKANVETELLPLTNRLKEAGYEVSIVVDFGEDSVEEISHIIAKREISLVAMSTRARVGVTRFFFRDMAEKVMKEVDVPVLLIHPEG